MIKKIALRILVLLAVITVCNYIYVFTTYKSDLHAEGNVLLKFERGLESADALYFSASPNAAIAKTDTDQRTIAQMMDDLLPDIKLEAVDTGGIHAGVYKKLVELIPENSHVKYVVINMNYRSFGIDWIESDLENSIQKELVFYHNRPPIVNRFLQGLNYYETKTTRERKELIQWHWQHDTLPFAPPRHNVTDWCAMEKWGDWTNPKRQLADSYIKNFAFTITEENPRLKDFDEIVEICQSKNLQLIFVILPENTEEGEILAGSELTNLMRSNKNQLVKRYRDKGVTVVDCLDSVPDSCFIERIFPSEHYNQFGRMTIAKAVTDALK